jgi:hypothetical protein
MRFDGRERRLAIGRGDDLMAEPAQSFRKTHADIGIVVGNQYANSHSAPPASGYSARNAPFCSTQIFNGFSGKA